MPELIINGLEAAAASWGVRMGEGFLDALTEPLTPKDPVENESRTEHGKRVVVDEDSVFFKSRDLTLDFTVEGPTPEEFADRKRKFLQAMYGVGVTLQVPSLGPEVYRLVYKGKGASYGMNWARTFCHVSLKFEEPNPMDREQREE